MFRTLIPTFVLLMIISCSEANNPTSSQDLDLKDEALEFAEKVVMSYFEGDKLAYKDYLPDTLYLTEYWEPPFPNTQLYVNEVFDDLDIDGYTLDDYYDVYTPSISAYSEYSTQPGFKALIDSLHYWKPDAHDYFFNGSEVKPGKEEFMLDDYLFFVVTKRTGRWKIRAY